MMPNPAALVGRPPGRFGRTAMDPWDIVIIAAAGYVAVVSLVRMMASRRNELINHVRQQLEQELRQQDKDKAERDAA